MNFRQDQWEREEVTRSDKEILDFLDECGHMFGVMNDDLAINEYYPCNEDQTTDVSLSFREIISWLIEREWYPEQPKKVTLRSDVEILDFASENISMFGLIHYLSGENSYYPHKNNVLSFRKRISHLMEMDI